jgi:hypothetical protein
MRALVCLAVLVGLAFTPWVLGDTPAKKAAPPTVEQLINQLSSPDAEVREKAGKGLAALGKEALPALIKARTNSDPEVRRRLEELIPPLEKAQLLTPKLISLHMTGKPIRDILNEIGRQSGYKLLTWPEEQPLGQRDKVVYTFHFDKLPFWEAIDKVCEGTGLVLQQGYWGDDALRFYQNDSFVPYYCYTGPFKVIATGFNYSRSNNFGQLPKNPPPQNQPTQEYLNVGLSVVTEPRLPVMSVGQVKLFIAEDDENHSMLPKTVQNEQMGYNPYGMRFWGGWRNYFSQTQANLLWPSKSAKKVRLLKGVIPVTLLADQKPSIVTDKLLAAKNKKYKVGSATFHIMDVNGQPGKQYTIRLGVSEENKENPNDYSRIQSMQQRLEVQDDKGNKHQCYVNITNWGNGPNNAELQLMIQPTNNAKIGPPTKLIYYAWVLMQHEVAFELKDLPLPSP